MTRERIAVLGPGGIGGLLAAMLATHGADVICVSPESTAIEIARQGILLSSAQFGRVEVNVDATSRLDRAVDVLCIAVKATQLDEALERIDEVSLGDALVVPFLNGVEHLAQLRLRFPNARVAAGTIRVEASRTAPGIVVQSSPFAKIELAPAPSDLASTEVFARLLRRAGFEVNLFEGQEAILWDKLCFLAPLALLTTVYDTTAGDLRSTHRDELIDVINEAITVARASGVEIEFPTVINQFDTIPATMQSSMQLDARAHRPMEIEAIGGAIERSAQQASIEVPRIASLVAELKSRFRSTL